jgi:hypothetical protein
MGPTARALRVEPEMVIKVDLAATAVEVEKEG